MIPRLLSVLLLGTPLHPWLEHLPRPLPETVPLAERFAPPEGFARVEVPAGSFSAWLRTLPVRSDRTEVLAHDGRPLARPAEALVLLDVGTRDLQQCADSAIRLHGEYLWQAGRAEGAAYHFTSGDRSSWRDWRRGERFVVRGANVERRAGPARAGTHAAYRAWLFYVFGYAGTRSLRFDTRAVPETAPLLPGDVFVDPGSPGHAVLLLDVAEHVDGRRAALIGQGFMPAEDFHVLRSGGPRVLDRVWFLLPDAAHPFLDTPSWAAFGRDKARRF